jgi:NAD(P)-dependent dehydrogenase (short-subunit alcohol dehydrogenase family)
VTQTVLTTGANSGIGLATVLEVARKGYHSVGSVRSEAKAETVQRAARRERVKVDTVLMDVNNATDCRRVIQRLKPYALVNNAGFPAVGAVEDVSDREARAVIETMVIAPMRLARLALPHMRDAGGGRIINISSIYGVATTPLSGWYQGAKHALEAVSDALRIEVASTGVKVVLIEPGGFKTGIWEEGEKTFERYRDSRYAKAYQRTLRGTRLSQPIMGDPATVARVVVNAIAGRNPRARYLVGYDAQLLAAVERLAPTIVKDRVSRLTLGL